ncbi:DUF6879 family protein [Kitasatospora sp. MAA4]|uniref:DUF6879 family protein n=1 Tax=Kitasatospora sp. MAA4 TaxID=3035093 RepID=UPI002475AF09|nr:DUF6879 family protein [Kitasatospora sp. MAA4]
MWLDEDNREIVFQGWDADGELLVRILEAGHGEDHSNTIPGGESVVRLFDGTAVLVNFFDGNGNWATPKQELQTGPDVVALCATAFEAVWERAVPHDRYSV